MEHNVYLSDDGESVVKTPNAAGEAWHVMSADLADRDQPFYEIYGINHVPTTVEEGPVVIKLRDGTAHKAAYVMHQPLVANADTLDVAMMHNDEALKNKFLEMIVNAEKLFKETQLGVDFIGGKAILDLLKALTMTSWKVRTQIYNVLVPREDQFDKHGRIFAHKGQPTVCDTRLYDCTADLPNVMSFGRRMIQQLQFEILHEFMESLNQDGGVRELEFGNLAHRLVAIGIHKGVFLNGLRVDTDGK